MADPAPIPIYSQQETFYVPAVQLYIRDQEVPGNVVRDLLQVTYKDSINEIDSVDLEINNWDADRRTFKFAPPLKDATEDYTGVFDPGAPIELWMGYQNNLRLMMRGQITTLAPNYPESGAPTLSVHALNELLQFTTEQHTRSWENKTDTDIAKELCGLPVKQGQAGLGIGIDPNPDPNEAEETFVFMNNQYDIVFLLERARRHGYEVYLEDGNGSGNPTLYFGLSESRALAPVYQLEWGKSLISFQPTLTTAKQVATVTVRGWDRKANKAIEQSYTLQTLWKDQGKSAAEIARLSAIAKAYGNRTEVVTDHPVHTNDEAKKLARAILEDNSKRQIEAHGATVGLPDLRSGCALYISGFASAGSSSASNGAGSDFNGQYYVMETTHTIGSGGYRTEFKARREGPLAGTGGSS